MVGQREYDERRKEKYNISTESLSYFGFKFEDKGVQPTQVVIESLGDTLLILYK